MATNKFGHGIPITDAPPLSFMRWTASGPHPLNMVVKEGSLKSSGWRREGAIHVQADRLKKKRLSVDWKVESTKFQPFSCLPLSLT